MTVSSERAVVMEEQDQGRKWLFCVFHRKSMLNMIGGRKLWMHFVLCEPTKRRSSERTEVAFLCVSPEEHVEHDWRQEAMDALRTL